MLADNPVAQRKVIAERVHLSRWRMKPRPSQRSLSLSLGWGENRVGQIERADPNVDLSLDEVFELADALNVDVNYLIGGTDDPAPRGNNSGDTIGGAIPGELSYPNVGLLTAA